MSHPVSWSPKDPDEVVNYELPWSAQLEEGDTVATSVWPPELVDGVTIDAAAISDNNLSTYVRLSGGVAGTTASLVNRVTTNNGETLEQLVELPIVSTELAPLADYAEPTPQHLVAKYPAFHDVAYATIAIYLQEAHAGVDTSWAAADYAPALMALAAHNMALLGVGAQSETGQYARAGVSSLRDGAFSVSFDDAHVKRASGHKFDATPYGAQYAIMLRRNKGGPRLVGGPIPNGGWGPLAQQNDGGILPWA